MLGNVGFSGRKNVNGMDKVMNKTIIFTTLAGAFVIPFFTGFLFKNKRFCHMWNKLDFLPVYPQYDPYANYNDGVVLSFITFTTLWIVLMLIVIIVEMIGIVL